MREATRGRIRGFARIGHFGYGHVDAIVEPGQLVEPGQHIGWPCRGDWHVHLSEFVFTGDGGRTVVNRLRRGGKLHPYVDRPQRASASFGSTRRRCSRRSLVAHLRSALS